MLLLCSGGSLPWTAARRRVGWCHRGCRSRGYHRAISIDVELLNEARRLVRDVVVDRKGDALTARLEQELDIITKMARQDPSCILKHRPGSHLPPRRGPRVVGGDVVEWGATARRTSPPPAWREATREQQTGGSPSRRRGQTEGPHRPVRRRQAAAMVVRAGATATPHGGSPWPPGDSGWLPPGEACAPAHMRRSRAGEGPRLSPVGPDPTRDCFVGRRW